MNTKRALLLSCSVILVCMSVIIGMTYALFSDSVSIEHHLRAGTLDVTLMRDSLSYAILAEDGTLKEETVGAYDFTEATETSIFGMDGSNVLIVPGSYFDARLSLGTAGDVAFDYTVALKGAEGLDGALAEQLTVTVTTVEDGATVTNSMKLSELAGKSETILAGTMLRGDTNESFSVRIDFPDVDDGGTTNNKAMGQSVSFDLVVTATQKVSGT